MTLKSNMNVRMSETKVNGIVKRICAFWGRKSPTLKVSSLLPGKVTFAHNIIVRKSLTPKNFATRNIFFYKFYQFPVTASFSVPDITIKSVSFFLRKCGVIWIWLMMAMPQMVANAVIQRVVHHVTFDYSPHPTTVSVLTVLTFWCTNFYS